MVECPRCRGMNVQQAAFCNQCGLRLVGGRRPVSRLSRLPLRWFSVILVLGILVVVALVGYLPESPESRVSDGSRAFEDSKLKTQENTQPAPVPAAESFLVKESEPQALDANKAIQIVRQALVVLELRGEDGRPLREERGILVDSSGVVLTRFQPLLGAHQGTCRLPGPREPRVEVTGLSYRDEERDLALVRVTRSPDEYPMVEILTYSPSMAPQPNETVFVVGREKATETSLDAVYHVCDDEVVRLRVAERPVLPSDPFLALDAYGLVLGLCKIEVDGHVTSTLRASSPGNQRVVVDPAMALAQAVDREAVVSLYELTRRDYEGTFGDLFAKGTVAYTQGRWKEAIDYLKQALDRVPLDRPDREDVAAATASLRESYLEEIQRLGDSGRTEEAALTAQDAAGRYPEEPVFLVRLAEARFLQQNWLAAIQALKSARELESSAQVDSFLEEVYLRLIGACAELGDVRAEEVNLLAGIQDLPSSGSLHLELAKLYFRLEGYADAIPLLRRVGDLSPALKGTADDLLGKIDDILKRREAVVIPIPPGSRTIRTQATIDGIKPFAFIIDTGASYTTVPSGVARELGYDLGTKAPRMNVSTAAGIISVPMIQVQSLNVGGYAVRNLNVLVIPESIGPELGLLGLNYLEHFRYTVDSSRNEFRLERP